MRKVLVPTHTKAPSGRPLNVPTTGLEPPLLTMVKLWPAGTKPTWTLRLPPRRTVLAAPVTLSWSYPLPGAVPFSSTTKDDPGPSATLPAALRMPGPVPGLTVTPDGAVTPPVVPEPLSVPLPWRVTALVIEPLTRRLPARTAVGPLEVLAPVRVQVPVPTLVSLPVPVTSPPKTVEVLSAPVVSAPLPRRTWPPAPDSEPIVSAKPFRLRVPKKPLPPTIVTAAESAICWGASRVRTPALASAPPRLRAPGSAVTPAGLFSRRAPRAICVAPA